MSKYLDFLLNLLHKEFKGTISIEEAKILSEIKIRAKKINNLEDNGLSFDEAEKEVNKDLI